ncbi:MAG: hypothetical protein ABFS56_25920 [Pseudomonadota bacterium]
MNPILPIQFLPVDYLHKLFLNYHYPAALLSHIPTSEYAASARC